MIESQSNAKMFARSYGGHVRKLNGTVVKSHGSADATGIEAAIRLAHTLAQSGFNQRLAARVASASMPRQDATTKLTDHGKKQ